VGTLGGYSSIWLGRALPPDGELVTLELEPVHAEVARSNLDRAGVGDRAEIRVGPALDSLRALQREGAGPFDLTFVDADKEHNADYVEWAVRLSRPGSLVIVDNVVRAGAVADAASTDSRVLGVRRLHEALASDPRVTATALQTVGTKGWDGLTVVLVLDPGPPTPG
jgi:predicted O-methyltransferase YrrM